MEEIVKHINDTNASYRTPNAGDAKNTDLFLDNEHYELFKGAGEQVTVRFSKENLSKAILFIASILPRKYDNSAMHKSVSYSPEFVYDQLAFLDYFFKEDGVSVVRKTQTWNARKDVPKKNGQIDNRFYFNGLLEEVEYVNSKGELVSSKFTIRNYLAGGYSDLHIKKAEDGIFDVWVTNVQEAYFDDKEDGLEELDKKTAKPTLQQIYYGAPGTGKSYKINEITKSTKNFTRTTFHPDSDYSTFVGCYKPTMEPTGTIVGGKEQTKISYSYVAQAFLQAYTAAWKNTNEPYYLIIEEINRGNCAQIFGDLFQLLDRDENGMSSYGITPDKDIANYLKKEFAKSEIENADIKSGNTMMLPSNLYILATMNTSDQSLFPIDSAFKRRWDWEYVPIEDVGKKHYIKVGNKKYDWWTFIDTINNSIDHITGSEDKKMGYWFVKPQNNDREITAKQFVGKVLFYLWNDVYKDYFDMSQCIFKIKNEDGTDEKKPFTYFFGNEADKRIQAFMAYNKIPFITIEDNVDDEDDEDNDDIEIDAEGNAVADSATQTKRRNLWVLFNQKMSAMGRSEANKEAMTLSHYDIRFKTSAFRIKNTVHVVPNASSPASVYSEICIRPKALWIYNQLEPKKDELQGLFEEDVVWRGDGDSHIAKIEHLANFDTEECRDAAMQWLAETSAKLYDYLKPIVDENK